VVTLYYREGASSEQLADLLGLSAAAVRKRLSRARVELRGELLARLGETLGRTAPGAGFVAAVIAMIAAPPSAAAAGLVSAGGAGASVAAKLWPVLGGAGLGLLGGLVGGFLGLRPYWRDAIDDAERAALRRFALIVGAITVLACLGFTLTGVLASPLLGVATQLGFVGSVTWLYIWRLPRLSARAEAIRAAADPTRGRRLARRRWLMCAALIVGIVASSWAMLAGFAARGWIS
jgi:Sigma-70, region 4